MTRDWLVERNDGYDSGAVIWTPVERFVNNDDASPYADKLGRDRHRVRFDPEQPDDGCRCPCHMDGAICQECCETDAASIRTAAIREVLALFAKRAPDLPTRADVEALLETP